MYTDPIADYLTRMRNAMKAGHKVVEMPNSKIKQSISQILVEQGYLLSYKVEENSTQGVLKLALKYDPITKTPAIRDLKRVSRPGLRKYTSLDSLPRVKNGLGIAILSTSKGVMTSKQATANNVGGEVLCYVF